MRRLVRGVLVGVLAMVGLLIAGCVASPVLWWLQGPAGVTVQVLDKTVPHPDYREHGALYWVLRHRKATAMDGSRGWDRAEHYVGFHPDPDDEIDHGHGERLEPDDLDGADLLFLADSYGVYRADYHREMEAGVDTSARIYGGMAAEEVDAIEDFVAAGGHLVGEFNTFASPTTADVRHRLQDLLGVAWSGWSGRFFPDLGDEGEVPRWAPRLWRAQQGQEWDFSGPGFLLVHENSRLVVLEEDVHVRDRGLTVTAVEGHPLVEGTVPGMPFTYWFDIVAPEAGSRILASFRLAAIQAGRDLLAEEGIPVEFPAVVVASESPLAAYFAGDFSDSNTTLGPHWLAGLPGLNRLLVRAWFPRGLAQDSFYWGLYVPLVGNVLETVSSN